MCDTTQQVKPELTSQCSLYAERNEAMSFSDTSEGCNRKTTKHCQCHHVSHCVWPHTAAIKAIQQHYGWLCNQVIKANLAPGRESVGKGTRGSLVDED